MLIRITFELFFNLIYLSTYSYKIESILGDTCICHINWILHIFRMRRSLVQSFSTNQLWSLMTLTWPNMSWSRISTILLTVESLGSTRKRQLERSLVKCWPCWKVTNGNIWEISCHQSLQVENWRQWFLILIRYKINVIYYMN